MEPVTIYADKTAADRVLARMTGVPTAIRNIFNGSSDIVSIHMRDTNSGLAMTFERSELVGIVLTYKRVSDRRTNVYPKPSFHAWAYTKDGSCNARIDLPYDQVPDMV